MNDRQRAITPMRLLALVISLAAAVLLAVPASALIANPQMYQPSRPSGTNTVKGKAYIGGNCGGYITCSFHTTVERSSWSGWRTVDNTQINNRFGWNYPTGRLLNGTYDYKTHFNFSVSQLDPWTLEIVWTTGTSDSAKKTFVCCN
jgi:hypothetical protein